MSQSFALSHANSVHARRRSSCASLSDSPAMRLRPGNGCMMRTTRPFSVLGTQRAQRVRSAIVVRAVSDSQYDYIIVGGGTAGCLLANRLSADSSKKVLVLEAGEDNSDFVVKAPAGLTRLFNHPILNWNLDSTKQKGVADRELYLSRGKLLGGSSAVNATLYHRGTAEDYDSWGIKGWGSSDVLPWFVAAEDNPAMSGSQYHSVGGGMHVERPIYQNPLFDTHFQASQQLGLKPNPDFNDWSRPQDGFGDFQVSITARGRRADAFQQFLKPVLSRENLTVVTRAQTTKVHIEKVKGKPTALGVEFQRTEGGRPTGGRESVRLADGGEVIMAAGAIHSPQILMLSGVGDSKQLSALGIECHSNLPGVGQNLQDHPGVLSAFSIPDSADVQCATDEVYDASGNISIGTVLKWLVLGKGVLTSTGCDRGAFIRTTPDKKQPDLQLRYAAAQALNPDAIKSYTEFGRLKELGQKQWPKGITFQVLAVRPKSRGSVSLASKNASERPSVDLGYCTDAAGEDRATLREGLRISRRLSEQPAWAPLLNGESHPGASVQSDAQLDEYMDRTMHSGNAIVGTCMMGTDPSAGAVVSSEDLGVHGVGALRVVDASVLPIIPGGQTGAPVVMVAERAAAMMIQRQPAVTSTKLVEMSLV